MEHSANIQRLIDGELSASDRAELLRTLDDNKSAPWREVALGFIEAQAFKEAFAIRTDQAVTIKRRAPRLQLAIAATLFIGIGLGIMSMLFFPAGNHQAVHGHQPSIAQQRGAASDAEDKPIGSRPSQAEIVDSQALALAENAMRDVDAAHVEQGNYYDRETAYIAADLGAKGRVIIPVSRFSARPVGL